MRGLKILPLRLRCRVRSLSVTQYAKIYGVSVSTASRWVQTYGLDLANPGEVLQYVLAQKSYPSHFDNIADLDDWTTLTKCLIHLTRNSPRRARAAA